MACRWQGVGASLRRRRSLLQEEQLEEKRAVPPAHQDTAAGTLGSLCRQLQRRLPLRAVSLNLGVGPSWKRLETPEPEAQGLQAAARSAKNALGAVSQVITTLCRGYLRCQLVPVLQEPSCPGVQTTHRQGHGFVPCCWYKVGI